MEIGRERDARLGIVQDSRQELGRHATGAGQPVGVPQTVIVPKGKAAALEAVQSLHR